MLGGLSAGDGQLKESLGLRDAGAKPAGEQGLERLGGGEVGGSEVRVGGGAVDLEGAGGGSGDGALSEEEGGRAKAEAGRRKRELEDAGEGGRGHGGGSGGNLNLAGEHGDVGGGAGELVGEAEGDGGVLLAGALAADLGKKADAVAEHGGDRGDGIPDDVAEAAKTGEVRGDAIPGGAGGNSCRGFGGGRGARLRRR